MTRLTVTATPLLATLFLAAGAQAAQLPAPRQVEAVRRPVDGYGERFVLGSPLVLVDLGSAEDRPAPPRETLSTMTLLGTEGVARLRLLQVVKVCEYLCADEIEECHYEGRFAPVGDLEAVGTPVAALPGEPTLEGFAPLPGEPGRELAVSLRTLPVSDQPSEPVWPKGNPDEAHHLLRREGSALFLDTRWGPSTAAVHTTPLVGCGLRDRGPLDQLRCTGFEALLDDGRPILTSMDDYDTAGADLLASFEHEGRRYYLLRLALKAQTVYGLLLREKDGWEALLLPRDYALLC